MARTDFEIKADVAIERIQWRGSHDGILWSDWRDISRPDAGVYDFDNFAYCQGRVLIDGHWHASPIETWD